MKMSSSSSLPGPELDEILKVATIAARLAGRAILEAAKQEASNVTEKFGNSTDLVTETDEKCEQLILDLIRKEFPSHCIIGEESNGNAKYELSEDPTWTIDPIDGTTNFVHRLKLSCVILSFIEKKEVQVAVVYDPFHEEIFHAVKGQGAFLSTKMEPKPRRIQVSSTKSLQQAVLTMDPGYGRDVVAVQRFCSLQASILNAGVRNVRVLGSTGLVMALTAAGRLDGAFEEGSWESGLGPKIWDFAAGKLLVEEAGGVTRDLENHNRDDVNESSLDITKRSFFCTCTVELASELMSIIVKDL